MILTAAAAAAVYWMDMEDFVTVSLRGPYFHLEKENKIKYSGTNKFYGSDNSCEGGVLRTLT